MDTYNRMISGLRVIPCVQSGTSEHLNLARRRRGKIAHSTLSMIVETKGQTENCFVPVVSPTARNDKTFVNVFAGTHNKTDEILKGRLFYYGRQLINDTRKRHTLSHLHLLVPSSFKSVKRFRLGSVERNWVRNINIEIFTQKKCFLGR